MTRENVKNWYICKSGAQGRGHTRDINLEVIAILMGYKVSSQCLYLQII